MSYLFLFYLCNVYSISRKGKAARNKTVKSSRNQHRMKNQTKIYGGKGEETLLEPTAELAMA